MALRYAEVARAIIESAYGLLEDSVFTTTELLERIDNEMYQAYVLDDDRTRPHRLSRLDAALTQVIADYERRRLLCPIEPGLVVNTYRPTLRLAPDLQRADRERRVRLSLVLTLREAVYAISPRQFELLCGEILREVGCHGITVTRSSKDDGVDAMAALRMRTVLEKGTPLYRMAGDVSFFVYLQAKAHGADNAAGPDEIYETQGSWDALRHGYADNTIDVGLRAAMVRADYRSADPVLLVLATTSRLTDTAVKKASDLGLLTLDGEQIAQLLLERSVGVGQYGPGFWYVDRGALPQED